MLQLITRHRRAAGLLLCILVAAVSLVALICPACDGVGEVHVHPVALAGSMMPPASDGCDGACSCCGLHMARPVAAELPATTFIVQLPFAANDRSPSWFTSPPFLPPRS
ncbi:MAG TPA: hypothetical protein VGB69_06175 [Edaphobacter sp.]